MLRAIAATTRDRVIGQSGQIPWHYPKDLKYFSQVTMGMPVVMGRKTWDSLPEKHRPLTGRHNIVLTRDLDWEDRGAIVRHSRTEVEALLDGEDAWIMGGQQTYELFWDAVEEVYLTLVPDKVEGDAFLPATPWDTWKLVDDRHEDGLVFRILRRKTR